MGLLTGVVANIQIHCLSLLALVDSSENANGSSSKFVEHSSVGIVRAFGESSMKRYLESWFNWIHAMFTRWGLGDTAADWLSWAVFGIGILFACVVVNYCISEMLYGGH